MSTHERIFLKIYAAAAFLRFFPELHSLAQERGHVPPTGDGDGRFLLALRIDECRKTSLCGER
jgi:hypothetical protein